MVKKQVIHDPDLGDIELPEEPLVSREEAARLINKQKAAFEKNRLWKDGAVYNCPSCGSKAFVGQSNLSHEVARPGGVVIFRHLKGAKCARCGAQGLEPLEYIQVEREAGVGQVADYEARISNIGSGTVGTYWPRDVVRVMELSPGKRAYIQVLDRDTALIKFSKGKTKRGGAKNATKKGAKKATKNTTS